MFQEIIWSVLSFAVLFFLPFPSSTSFHRDASFSVYVTSWKSCILAM